MGLVGVEVVGAEETAGGLGGGGAVGGETRGAGVWGRVLSKGWKRARLVKYATHGTLKETVRRIYQTNHPPEGDQYTRLLAAELQDQSCSPELNQLGRTLHTWHSQIVAWHHAQISNGLTESANNLIKRVKRVAFGFRNFRNYRTRILGANYPPPTG